MRAYWAALLASEVQRARLAAGEAVQVVHQVGDYVRRDGDAASAGLGLRRTDDERPIDELVHRSLNPERPVERIEIGAPEGETLTSLAIVDAFGFTYAVTYTEIGAGALLSAATAVLAWRAQVYWPALPRSDADEGEDADEPEFDTPSE